MMTDLRNAPSLVGFSQLLSKNGAPSAPEKKTSWDDLLNRQ